MKYVLAEFGHLETRQNFILPVIKLVNTVEMEPHSSVPEFLNIKQLHLN